MEIAVGLAILFAVLFAVVSTLLRKVSADFETCNENWRNAVHNVETLNRVLDEEEETNRILIVRCVNSEKERDEWKKACDGLRTQLEVSGNQIGTLRDRIQAARAALED